MPPELMTLPSELRLRAAIDVSSYDPKTGEFEMTISTGAAVERVDFWTGNRWVERLEISKSAVDLARLKDGAPLADTHNVFSLEGVVGVMRDAWVEGSGENARLKGRGKLSMADDPKLARVRRDVEDGVIRNVSVGYRVRAWRITKADAEKGLLEQRTATRWVPHEVSLVPVGADPGAGIGRSEPSNGDQSSARGEFTPQPDGSFEFVRAIPDVHEKQDQPRAGGEGNHGGQGRAQPQENPMPPEVAEKEAKERAEKLEREKIEAERKAADEKSRAAERDRIRGIQEAARDLGLAADHEDVRKLIDDGTDVDKAARALIGVKAKAQPKIQPTHGARAEVGEEQYSRMLAGAETALAARMGCTGVKADEGEAREMRNLSLLDMGRELLIEKGVISRSQARSMTKRELATRSVHGTSDFPKITANAANKRLQQAYQVQPRTFAQVVNVVDVADFKQVSVAHLGGISALEEVGEHGEFHYATIGEKAETYVLSTWGKIVALSRQLIINDDLRAFANMTAKLGRAASVLENNLHWALRTGNKVMSDGNGVYHSSHGNVGTKALGLDGLGLAFQTMLKQRDVGPKAGELGDYINVTPAILTVPPELLHLALQLTADITPGTVSAANPYRGKLAVEVEPRLSAAGVTNGATTWFLDAKPSDWPTWELAYLEGERGPVVESREGFEVDGVEIKVRHDVAMAPIDWVGTFRSDGTVA